MKKNLILIGLILSFVITPIKTFADIILSKSQITIYVGETSSITATGSDEIGWDSKNNSIATIDNNGVIKGVSAGETYVYAYDKNNPSIKKLCLVKVNSVVEVTSVTLDNTNISLQLGTTKKLNATIYPNNAPNKNITWSSSDNSIASVDSNGNITTHKAGNVTITANASGKKATCNVNVYELVKLSKISLNKTSATIKEQESINLEVNYTPTNASNKKINWKSSNSQIATVDNNGKVTGVSSGKTTIIAESVDGNNVATCTIAVEKVSKEVTKVELDKTSITLEKGQKASVVATISPTYADNKKITWKSNDKKIATVSDSGEITAVGIGKTDIIVTTTDNKKTATCSVTVIGSPLENVVFKEETITIYKGESITLEPIFTPEDSSLTEPIWESTDENIATVENGTVIGSSVGKTIITVKDKNPNITASIEVQIIYKPKEEFKLTIEGYNLNFDKNVTNYNLKIKREKKLNIINNREDIEMNIIGNDNLKNGSIITIQIDGTNYLINIQKSTDYTILFITIISILLLINLLRIYFKNKKLKNER